MNLSLGHKKIHHQLNLDEQLRKAKKQFNKLPDYADNFDKWILLDRVLRKNSVAISAGEVEKIFFLTDEEADPFYSIQVENIGEYYVTVQKMVLAYISA